MAAGGSWQENKEEALAICRLALPVSANYLLNRLVGFTSVLFVGRWGPAPMAAAALGFSLVNVIGPGVLNGLTGGMSTLCGQVSLLALSACPGKPCVAAQPNRDSTDSCSSCHKLRQLDI